MSHQQSYKSLDVGFDVPLKGGEQALVRPLTSADRAGVEAAFEHLSAETRANRWLSPIAKLPPNMLTYLTEVDQHNHVAWAIGFPSDELDVGIGVGRFVRLEDEPEVAEFALTVVDEYQGKHIGTFLLALLYRLAQHNYIKTLRGVIGPDNVRMIEWMKRLGATVYRSPDELVVADLAVTDPLDLPDNSTARRFRRTFDCICRGEAEYVAREHRSQLPPAQA